MPRHPFPWWCHYFWENPLRRALQRPEAALSPHVEIGMTCLEVGCGLGTFTLPLARLTGVDGRVIAVDVKEPLLARVRRRAERAGLAQQVQTVCAPIEELNVDCSLDFVLAMWSMHETDDPGRAARRIAERMRPGARVLMAEPLWHVFRPRFWQLVGAFLEAGLQHAGAPRVRFSHAALLQKAAL